MDISGKLNQANGRLKAGRVGVRIEAVGNRLYLRATFPPKPGSSKSVAHQQRLATGFRFNPNGIQLAEKEARIVGSLLDADRFDWHPYLKVEVIAPQTVQQWVERFEQEYFSVRARNLKSQTTWDDDYLKALKKLPSDQALTVGLIRKAIDGTKPDSKTRKRVCMVFSGLCKLAALDFDPLLMAGKYSPRRVNPRDIPDDLTITEWFFLIESPEWQWVYGVMAAYGLRNHEVFHLDIERLRRGDRVISVLPSTKTGDRRVWCIFPEWFDDFDLGNPKLPGVDLNRNNTKIGRSVTQHLRRVAKLPFQPYNLRHAWAIRSLEFGLPVELAAQQMGHSVQVHCDVYHKWISDRQHQRAYDLLIQRPDRPTPPKPS